MIDFKKKRIISTGYKFKFTPTERSEDWTVEDELMSLSLYIQMQLIAKKNDMNNVDFYDWQQKIEETAIETSNKSYATGTGQLQSDTYGKRPEYKSIKELFLDFEAYALDYMGNYVFTEEGEEQRLEDKKHARAVAEAKKEYEIEQEELEELRLEEEAEELAKQKSEDVDIVIPFRNYGK